MLALDRSDKEKLERKCANLEDSLAHIRRELAKVREQNQSLEGERCKNKEKVENLEQVGNRQDSYSLLGDSTV